MTAHRSTAVSSAYYGGGPWFDETDITVERDGDNVQLDAYQPGLDDNDYPLGKPGVGMVLTPVQAITLARSLLAAVIEEPMP